MGPVWPSMAPTLPCSPPPHQGRTRAPRSCSGQGCCGDPPLRGDATGDGPPSQSLPPQSCGCWEKHMHIPPIPPPPPSSPQGLQSGIHPRGPWAPRPALAEGDEEEDAWVGDQGCSSLPPQHLLGQHRSSRERSRFGTMLPGSAAPARAREHPEPVGRCRAHRGKKLRPHSCESQPYRREGAVLPWRKGSS